MPGSALTSTPGCAPAWRGRSPTPRQVRVPSRQGRARDGRLGEGDPQDHGRGRALGACSKRRRYSSYEGETTPAPGNLVNRDFTAERPNEKWLTDITEIKARDGKVYLSPMIDCHDARSSPTRLLPSQRGARQPDARRGGGDAARQRPSRVHSDRGCHYRWPGWLELMERYG